MAVIFDHILKAHGHLAEVEGAQQAAQFRRAVAHAAPRVASSWS